LTPIPSQYGGSESPIQGQHQAASFNLFKEEPALLTSPTSSDDIGYASDSGHRGGHGQHHRSRVRAKVKALLVDSFGKGGHYRKRKENAASASHLASSPMLARSGSPFFADKVTCERLISTDEVNVDEGMFETSEATRMSVVSSASSTSNESQSGALQSQTDAEKQAKKVFNVVKEIAESGNITLSGHSFDQ